MFHLLTDLFSLSFCSSVNSCCFCPVSCLKNLTLIIRSRLTDLKSSVSSFDRQVKTVCFMTIHVTFYPVTWLCFTFITKKIKRQIRHMFGACKHIFSRGTRVWILNFQSSNAWWLGCRNLELINALLRSNYKFASHSKFRMNKVLFKRTFKWVSTPQVRQFPLN